MGNGRFTGHWGYGVYYFLASKPASSGERVKRTELVNQDDVHHPFKGKECLPCCQAQCVDFSPDQSPCHKCRSALVDSAWAIISSIPPLTEKELALPERAKMSAALYASVPSATFLLPHEIETHHVVGTAECLLCKQYHFCHNQCYIQSTTKLEERRKLLLRSQKRKSVRSQSLEEKYFSTIY